MSGGGFPLSLAVGGRLKRFDVGAAEPVRIGFLAPLSGPAQSWGLPGLMGARIWVDWINRAGGLMVGGRRHRVDLVEHDCGTDPDAAVVGARRLVQDQGARFLLMLGGDTFRPVARYLTDRKVLTSTLLPSDLSPDTPYLIAPSEIHPLYNVTAVDWLAQNRPGLRTVVLARLPQDLVEAGFVRRRRSAAAALGQGCKQRIGAHSHSGASPRIRSIESSLCWASAMALSVESGS